MRCLLLIAPYAVAASNSSYSRVMLCSHHPCIISLSHPKGVWKVYYFFPLSDICFRNQHLKCAFLLRIRFLNHSSQYYWFIFTTCSVPLEICNASYLGIGFNWIISCLHAAILLILDICLSFATTL